MNTNQYTALQDEIRVNLVQALSVEELYLRLDARLLCTRMLEQAGLDTEDVAAALGMSENAISERLFFGGSPMTLEFLSRFATVCGFSISLDVKYVDAVVRQ